MKNSLSSGYWLLKAQWLRDIIFPSVCRFGRRMVRVQQSFYRFSITIMSDFQGSFGRRPPNGKRVPRKRARMKVRIKKKDPLLVDGKRPRPMYVDYKDIELLSKLVNRHGRIVSRRKSGCSAASQHAVSQAVKRARFMALMPYVGD